MMFAKRASTVGIIAINGRGAAHAGVMTVARSSRGCAGIWRRNPVSGRLELRWEAVSTSPRQSDAEEAASTRPLPRMAQTFRAAA